VDQSTPDLRRIRSLLQNPDPITWVFTGDSITQGALHTFGWRCYPEHFAERISWELQRVRDVTINTALSGKTLPPLLDELDDRVLRFRPTIVSIMIGTNDSAQGVAGRETFAADYRRMLNRLRQADPGPAVLLHTPNPVTPADPYRQDLPAYCEIIRSVAGETGAALVDHDRRWRLMKTPLEYLLGDGTVHPNPFGQILLAQETFRVLGIFDNASAVCRLFVP
jgi:lysophospholipase L1-like esterase